MDNIREPISPNTIVPTRARFTTWMKGLCIFVLFFQAAISLSDVLGTRLRKSRGLDIDDPALVARRAALVRICNDLHKPVGPPQTFSPSSRIVNDRGNERWVPGTPPLLIKNARIWVEEGVIERGDVFIDKGLIVASGVLPPSLLRHIRLQTHTEIVDARGRWLTPGLIDVHSHLGVNSAPALQGAFELNSLLNPVQPWARSVDALNTHDEGYRLAIAGGVTTAQILPGSGNNIGGQAVVIKLRETKERSTTSKLVEPPESIVKGAGNESEWVHWRHMKHACGENPDHLYSQTRMDGLWNFRNAYDTARRIKVGQDAFCDKVEKGDWDNLALAADNGMPEFPEDLKWESLVDVLRGRVKMSIHCYEAVDLDGMVRLSNEFKFHIASFHHAGEAYLVPDLLKKMWGGPPIVSLFASNFRTKREAYRSSEFAPRILTEHGIPVVMKSDHPVINSRYLMFEAQQAHYYGLDPLRALASVTSVPATMLGLGHRIGKIAEGYDADLVLWDSHPLSLGATPVQVFIDGLAQLTHDAPVVRKEDKTLHLPRVPNFDKERNGTVEWQGNMPLRGRMLGPGKRVRVVNISEADTTLGGGEGYDKNDSITWKSEDKSGQVVIEDGRIICSSPSIQNANGCPSISMFEGHSDSRDTSSESEVVVDLQGGELRVGLTTYGAPIGLVEIRLEPSTNDGGVHDPLLNGNPPRLVREAGIVQAADGLAFEGRNLLLAYRSGIITGITAPSGAGFQSASPVLSAPGFLQGVSTAFSLGAQNALTNGAIVQTQTAMHITLSYNLPASVSTQVAALRRMLFEDGNGSWTDGMWQRIREGDMTLVVTVENADIMATLLSLKNEYERNTSRTLKLTFSGATEAHLLADRIAAAGVSVILTKMRPFPSTWEQRRILPGPPLSHKTALLTLVEAGVNTAIGVLDEAEAHNTPFELAWAYTNSNGTLSKTAALALASTNLHKALGYMPPKHVIPDIVMYHGGEVFDFNSKVIGIISMARRVVELF